MISRRLGRATINLESYISVMLYFDCYEPTRTFIELQIEKYRGLSSCIEIDHNDFGLFCAKLSLATSTIVFD